jgi:hypothetical protein
MCWVLADKNRLGVDMKSTIDRALERQKKIQTKATRDRANAAKLAAKDMAKKYVGPDRFIKRF